MIAYACRQSPEIHIGRTAPATRQDPPKNHCHPPYSPAVRFPSLASSPPNHHGICRLGRFPQIPTLTPKRPPRQTVHSPPPHEFRPPNTENPTPTARVSTSTPGEQYIHDSLCPKYPNPQQPRNHPRQKPTTAAITLHNRRQRTRYRRQRTRNRNRRQHAPQPPRARSTRLSACAGIASPAADLAAECWEPFPESGQRAWSRRVRAGTNRRISPRLACILPRRSRS